LTRRPAYASELSGVYQPLLGWKSKRVQKRVVDGANRRNDQFGG
jgi:hypothetical protein